MNHPSFVLSLALLLWIVPCSSTDVLALRRDEKARLGVGEPCSTHSNCTAGLLCKSLSPFSGNCSESSSCFCLSSLQCTGDSDCRTPLRCLNSTIFDGYLPQSGDFDMVCGTSKKLGSSCTTQNDCPDDALRCRTSIPPFKRDCTVDEAVCACAIDFTCTNNKNCQAPYTCVTASDLNPTLSDDKFCFFDFSRCTAQANCTAPEFCRSFTSPTRNCSSSDSSCFCLNLSFCSGDSECLNDMKCMEGSSVNSKLPAGKFCFTDNATICIGVHHLEGLSRDDLVFEKDSLANVFCDENNSCATPGHIVTYKSKAMMMKTYCASVGCEKKVIRVNSPRYGIGRKVDSNSESLQFTTFAAKYATKAEERMLAVIVHAGL